MFRYLLLLVSTLLLLFCSVNASDNEEIADSHNGRISVSLNASWTATSPIAEGIEFFAESPYGQDMLWRYIDAIAFATTLGIPLSSEKSQLEAAVVAARSILPSKNSAALFRLSIITRQYSPKVRIACGLHQSENIHHNISFAVVDGIAFVDAVNLGSYMNGFTKPSDMSKIQGTDHVLWAEGVKMEDRPSKTTIILYAVYHDSAFSDMHQMILSFAKAGKAHYILRHHCDISSKLGVLGMSAFGVELSIKNTEYIAVDDDDSQNRDIADGDSSVSARGHGFNFNHLRDRLPHYAMDLKVFEALIEGKSLVSKNSVSPENIKEVGLQVATVVMKAFDPLRILTQVSQNLPSILHMIESEEVDSTFRDLFKSLGHVIASTDPRALVSMTMNGHGMDPHALSPFDLAERLLSDVCMAEVLSHIRLSVSSIRSLLSRPSPQSSTSSKAMRIDVRSPSIVFMNDIEKDDQYANWPTSFDNILHPNPRSQLAVVRRNVLTVVMAIDAGDLAGLRMATGMFRPLSNSFPIRLGLILVPGEYSLNADSESKLNYEFGLAVTNCFYYVKEKFGSVYGLKFISDVFMSLHMRTSSGVQVLPKSISNITLTFKSVLKQFRPKWSETKIKSTANRIVKSKNYDDKIKENRDLVNRLGISRLLPVSFVNGAVMREEDMERSFINTLLSEQRRIQTFINDKKLTTEVNDIYSYTLSQPDVFPRYNHEIIPSAEETGVSPVTYVRLQPFINHEFDFLSKSWSDLSNAHKTSRVTNNLGYLHHPGTELNLKPITVWIVTDWSRHGLKLGLQAILRVSSSTCTMARYSLISSHSRGTELSMLFHLVTSSLPSHAALQFISAVLNSLLSEGDDPMTSGLVAARDAAMLELSKENQIKLKDVFSSKSMISTSRKIATDYPNFVTSILNLAEGANAIVVNGRVVMQPKDKDLLEFGDYALLEKYEFSSRVEPIADILMKKSNNTSTDGVATMEAFDTANSVLTHQYISDSIMFVSSQLASQSVSRSSVIDGGFNTAGVPAWIKERIPPIRGGSSNQTFINIEICMDPLSRVAQRMAPMLLAMSQYIPFSFDLYLIPGLESNEAAFSNYYRYVLPTDITFDSLDRRDPPMAKFYSLPSSVLMTLSMDAPESWMLAAAAVQPKHDLDNIMLSKIGGSSGKVSLSATFELQKLMIVGSCIDVTNGQPPRGLQVELLDSFSQKNIADTIVMSNMGYFQLQGVPGIFSVGLVEGLSRKTYEIASLAIDGSSKNFRLSSNLNSFTNSGNTSLTMKDLRGVHLVLLVKKRPGMEHVEILRDTKSENYKSDESSGGVWDSVASLWGSNSEPASAITTATHDDEDCIHIFSVASGSLYERFLKIMILSVIKNTSHKVKFWFLSNYASSDLLREMHILANQYKFKYQFVSYKWPGWLRRQSVKQRIIWGHKILFLDVLFPLRVKKIIFIDADQIVRSDINDLWSMDLGGRSIAMTPFCDSRKEIEGFRFWKQGFWKSHLNGGNYHISALFVVDLQRFRLIAAGDQYRILYESLTQDPNSLANLDQDLPNYAQMMVPIYSLPLDWLWCETWCDDESKTTAKTIDLCNNPMTKTRKLDNAKRIVPEWIALDSEIKKHMTNNRDKDEL